MSVAAPVRMARASGAGSAVATATLLEQLERALEGLIGEHERLAELARAQRGAVSAADAGAIERIVREQRERMRVVAELDAQRHEAAGMLAVRLGVQGATVSAIAAAAPGGSGGSGERLRQLGERLRGALVALQREHAVVRSAAETVFSHIDGMMQQLARKFSQAGTYSRPGARVVVGSGGSALDLTT